MSPENTILKEAGFCGQRSSPIIMPNGLTFSAVKSLKLQDADFAPEC